MVNMADYTVEIRSADGDTIRAQLHNAPTGLLANVTPQEVRDSLRTMLKIHVTTDTAEISRFFDDPATSTTVATRRKVA